MQPEVNDEQLCEACVTCECGIAWAWGQASSVDEDGLCRSCGGAHASGIQHAYGLVPHPQAMCCPELRPKATQQQPPESAPTSEHGIVVVEEGRVMIEVAPNHRFELFKHRSPDILNAVAERVNQVMNSARTAGEQEGHLRGLNEAHDAVIEAGNHCNCGTCSAVVIRALILKATP